MTHRLLLGLQRLLPAGMPMLSGQLPNVFSYDPFSFSVFSPRSSLQTKPLDSHGVLIRCRRQIISLPGGQGTHPDGIRFHRLSLARFRNYLWGVFE
jgi:hypothetical protein